MNDPAIVVHKGSILLMRPGGIVPHSELSGLWSYGSRVSARNNANGRIIRLRSLLVALESAGVLVTNGDGVLGAFGLGGEC